MATDTTLRASEIKNVLLGEIERYDDALQAEQVGEVLEVKDGIARIYGLKGTMASEMLEITSSSGGVITALALNLEEDNIGAVVLGDWTAIQEGDQVRRTARVLDIPVTGLDFLVPSVEGPDYVIIEANERPGLANHEPQPTAQRFVDLLFPLSGQKSTAQASGRM